MPLRRTRARVQGRGIPSATLCIPRKRKHAHNDTLSRARSRTHKDKGGDRLVLSKCEECETRPVTVTEEKHSPEKRLLMPRCHAAPRRATPRSGAGRSAARSLSLSSAPRRSEPGMPRDVGNAGPEVGEREPLCATPARPAQARVLAPFLAPALRFYFLSPFCLYEYMTLVDR